MSKRNIRKNFDRNIARTRGLLNVYDNSVGPGRPDTILSDLLRAAVVMLHAAFEDACRSVAAQKLPTADSAVLEDIPFVGTKGRAKAIHLGELSKHRGKTVDDLIQESITQFLDGFSVNNASEIDAYLQKIGIVNPGSFRRSLNFGTLCIAIKRRHHIVHQADKNPTGGRGHHAAQPISRDTVEQWITVVEKFIHTLLDTIWPPRR
ncbi:hypothetical protein LH435_15775 [Laribacter hongkongensis]|uniref:HEPN domain-containing protein n=1 Tax=Laribacter hongkongensis TaxID=168471 RepID=UPI001EFE81E9|nr:HEPN domain-containing protein [Laribacter hongkongensis]MCG8996733.1 hypothetical protein [Laribacter hongkongensis]MCG9011972.1 hypothetical protein [Laribacter hongkongensis]MCG9024217.1 hypothetical protein [Laribacter hongkongensis]MCG9048478.1 hypothetical protein [Laribacter hongkongensis]MCG9075425.1 hypothetical protein [Laribacter hongkongensis]